MKSNSDQNLAEPITLNYHDALIFCRDNVCATCHNQLFVYGFEGSFLADRYHIYCYKCKKKIYEGDYISKDKVDEVKRVRAIGKREMSKEPRKKITTDQAIKDLGF